MAAAHLKNGWGLRRRAAGADLRLESTHCGAEPFQIRPRVSFTARLSRLNSFGLSISNIQSGPYTAPVPSSMGDDDVPVQPKMHSYC